MQNSAKCQHYNVNNFSDKLDFSIACMYQFNTVN